MTRYLLANLLGALLLTFGVGGALGCIFELAGWTGLLLVLCVAVMPVGRRLARLSGPPAPYRGGYTYERDAR